jgi:hypothetical protein
MRALVIGGTGPTGHFIVNGLRARGFAVAMLHSGRHELAEIPDDASTSTPIPSARTRCARRSASGHSISASRPTAGCA